MKTNLYIISSAAISPLQAMEEDNLRSEWTATGSNKALCIEPNYKDYIPSIKARRMSRILKMTWVSANRSIENTNATIPQMISVATGMGCQSDTLKFLEQLISDKEKYLKPTAFINSTHNTLAGFLAIGLKAKGQNFTFTHSDLNFEHALLDTALRMQNKEVENALIGAVDETNDQTHRIKELMGLLRKEDNNKLILPTNDEAYIDGEAAIFFYLENTNSPKAKTKISGLDFKYAINKEDELNKALLLFVKNLNIEFKDIDYIILGCTGDYKADMLIEKWKEKEQLQHKSLYFKHISGEYMSSAAFGLWLSSKIIEQNKVPKYLNSTSISACITIQRILLINHNGQSNYSFTLIENNE